jgi:hypothetical protein
VKLDDVKFASVDGGQFDSIEPSAIPKNGWERAFNFLPYHRRMNHRPGSSTFGKSTPPLSGAIACYAVSGLVGAPAGYTEWALLVATKTMDFALLNAAGKWTAELTQLPGGSTQTDEQPPFMRQRNGLVYVVRRGSGGMKRVEGNEWTNAGRPAPGAGATAAWAASGGSLTANPRRVAYTYYDSSTTYEGNGIEITVTGSPAANGKIQVASLQPASADVKWTHYRIYMTAASGAIFYPVALVAKASSSYDILADSTSAETLSGLNGLPATDAIGFDIWNERGWIITEKDLFYSPFHKVESYTPVQNLPFNPDDNDEYTTCYGWGDNFVVSKRRSMVLLSGIDRTTWDQELWTEMAGCTAPHSMRDCEGELVWKGEDGFYAATLGEKPKLISSKTVAKALKQLDPTKEDLITADLLSDLKLYVASFPRKDGSWGGLAYNWESKAWSEFEFPAKPRFLYSGFDASGAVRVFAIMTTSEQPFVVFEGRTDDGSPIDGELISGSPDTGGPELAGVKTVAILCAPTRYPVTLSMYIEGDTTTPAVPARVALLRGDRGWKRIATGGLKNLGTQLQVGIRYQGADEYWIQDMTWEVGRTTYEKAIY